MELNNPTASGTVKLRSTSSEQAAASSKKRKIEDDSEDDQEEVEDKPTKKGRKAKEAAKPKPKAIIEEEEEEEEEEEKPVKKNVKGKGIAKRSSPDDDSDSGEEEEKPAPKKTRSARVVSKKNDDDDSAEEEKVTRSRPKRVVQPSVKKDASFKPLLADKWDEDKGKDPTGYLISEKLDGVRAYWNGTSFYSREGNPFYAPEWFTKRMPKDVCFSRSLVHLTYPINLTAMLP